MAVVKVDGLKELEQNLAAFNVDIAKAIDDAVLITAIGVQETAIAAIRTPSKGKTYVRSKNVVHIASAKGEAPNTDTSDLIKSIAIEHQRGSQVAEVGTNLDYGRILETKKDRPWLMPALDKNVANFADKVVTLVTRQINNA